MTKQMTETIALAEAQAKRREHADRLEETRRALDEHDSEISAKLKADIVGGADWPQAERDAARARRFDLQEQIRELEIAVTCLDEHITECEANVSRAAVVVLEDELTTLAENASLAMRTAIEAWNTFQANLRDVLTMRRDYEDAMTRRYKLYSRELGQPMPPHVSAHAEWGCDEEAFTRDVAARFNNPNLLDALNQAPVDFEHYRR